MFILVQCPHLPSQVSDVHGLQMCVCVCVCVCVCRGLLQFAYKTSAGEIPEYFAYGKINGKSMITRVYRYFSPVKVLCNRPLVVLTMWTCENQSHCGWLVVLKLPGFANFKFQLRQFRANIAIDIREQNKLKVKCWQTSRRETSLDVWC